MEVSGGYGYPGPYIGGSFNVLVNSIIYAVKFSDNAEGDYRNRTSQEFIADEYALMVGKKLTRNSFSNFILSAGVAVDKFIFRGAKIPPGTGTFYDDGNAYDTQIGIPVEIKYLNNYGLKGWAGVTAAASVNINLKRPFFYLTVGVALGHLRERK